MGRGTERVSTPNRSWAVPWRNEASPMVAMMTATTGRPMRWRSTAHSTSRPTSTMTTRARKAATTMLKSIERIQNAMT